MVATLYVHGVYIRKKDYYGNKMSVSCNKRKGKMEWSVYENHMAVIVLFHCEFSLEKN